MTLPVAICIAPDRGWTTAEMPRARVWFKGYLFNAVKTLEGQAAADWVIAAFDASLDVDSVLSRLSGHFALVLQTPEQVVATVDRVRSIPLLWGSRDGTIHIDDRGRPLRDRLQLSPADLDPDQALAVAMSGYTIGAATLYRGMRQLRAGEALIVDKTGPRTRRWFVYDAWRTEPIADPERKLSELHRFMIERLAASALGRPICVPLSAGLDSRMIAAGLKEVGYRDVRLFAYGRAGNHEAATSKAIAERLGFPWTFVPFTDAAQRAMFSAPAHQGALREKFDTCGSIPFEQDWIAIETLKANGWIPADAIIVNGQSGDFITGNHVPSALLNKQLVKHTQARRERVYENFLAKHYGMWRSLLTSDNWSKITALLDAEVNDAGASFTDESADHGIHEFLEYQDRQAKFVISNQRTYEAMDLAWRLPLWDDEYVLYWRRAPIELKARQNLYRRVLEEDNWGDVWTNIPVNAKTIRPRWLVPARLAAKITLAPLGREHWHRAEQRLFGWWMDPLRVSAIVSYFDALCDNRGPRHAVAWVIEHYLSVHGVAIDDLMRRHK